MLTLSNNSQTKVRVCSFWWQSRNQELKVLLVQEQKDGRNSKLKMKVYIENRQKDDDEVYYHKHQFCWFVAIKRTTKSIHPKERTNQQIKSHFLTSLAHVSIALQWMSVNKGQLTLQKNGERQQRRKKKT